MIGVALLMALLPMQVAGGPGGGTSAARAAVHHVLVLDDSGSMEIDFDVHGLSLIHI